jgi:hypothetical protein
MKASLREENSDVRIHWISDGGVFTGN